MGAENRCRSVRRESVVERARGFLISNRDDRVFLDGIDIQDHLHTDSVDRWVAQVSAIVRSGRS
jgi:cytidylate kinase